MQVRFVTLTSIILALSVARMVQAQDATWSGAVDHLWSNPDNWSEFPTLDHWAKIRNGLPGPTIDFEGAVARRVHIGYSEGGALTMDGGTLVVGSDDLRVGKQNTGVLTLYSGSIDIARDLDISDATDGSGVVNMYGGTINIGDDLELPNTAGNSGILNMVGGTINITDNLDMLEAGDVKLHLRGGTIHLNDDGDLDVDDEGEFDLGAGTLIIAGDALATVQDLVDTNVIYAYGGPNDANGTVLMDYDPNSDQTSVTALHKYDPVPADARITLPGVAKLEWTVDPGTVVNVWLGTTPEWSAFTWTKIVDEQAVTSANLPTDVAPKTSYFWAVDVVTEESRIYGPTFSFIIDNAPPVVQTSGDGFTWLDNGMAVVDMSATVEDADPVTWLWSVVSEPDDPNAPDAVIADPAALDTSVTLSASGEYVLQLQADDGEKQGVDTLTIQVYSDQCEAAKSDPDWQPLAGDINLDCVVDQTDLDLLLEQWLNCNGLECPEIDPVDPNLL